MKRLLVIAVLALASLTFACKYVVPQFNAAGTDGATYKTTGLVGKPTVFVFIQKDGKADTAAISHLNRLAACYKGHVQVLAIFDGDLTTAKRYAKHNRVIFPLIADANKAIANGFEAKGNWDMTLVAAKSGEPRFPKIWNGYSKANVEELLAGIEHHGFVLPKVK